MTKQTLLIRIRWAVSLLYFGMGLYFATLLSIKPVIKTALNPSEDELVSILFALPVGLLLAMIISEKTVERFGNLKLLPIALTLYTTGLICLGLAK